MDDEEVELGNEFATVVLQKVHTRNGVRLRIASRRSQREILLCPLELESLTWQDHETFSRFLGEPFGPEAADDGRA